MQRKGYSMLFIILTSIEFLKQTLSKVDELGGLRSLHFGSRRKHIEGSQ